MPVISLLMPCAGTGLTRSQRCVRLLWLKGIIDYSSRLSLTATIARLISSKWTEAPLSLKTPALSGLPVHPPESPHHADMSTGLFTRDQSVAPVMSPTHQAKPQSSVQMAGLVSDLPGVCADIVLYKYTHLHSSSEGSSVNSLLHLTWVVLSLQPVHRLRGCSVIFIRGLWCLKKSI